MTNPLRGEVELVIDQKPYTLCLTLGALAHLEASLEVHSLADLTEKLSAETLKMDTLLTVIEAGLIGGGHHLGRDSLKQARIDGGLAAIMAAVSRLFHLTFNADQSHNG